MGKAQSSHRQILTYLRITLKNVDWMFYFGLPRQQSFALEWQGDHIQGGQPSYFMLCISCVGF